MDDSRLGQVARVLGEVEGPPVLERLLALSVEMLSVSGAGIAIIRDGQHRGAVAVSAPAYREVDELQFELGEGPCIDADGGGGPVLEPDLRRSLGQWPSFARAALALGINATFSLPLRMGAIHLGVLNLYRDTTGDLGATDLRDASELTHILTHLLLELEAGVMPGMVPEHLSEVVDHRARVHQATGMIAAQLDVDAATALSRLRAYAWSRDRSIDEIAIEVVTRRLRFGGGMP